MIARWPGRIVWHFDHPHGPNWSPRVVFEMVGIPTIAIVSTVAVFIRADGQWKRDSKNHQKDAHLSSSMEPLLVHKHVE